MPPSVVVVVSCVSCVLCLVLWCETLQNPRVWIQKRLRVYIQNVPVCTGTTRKHVLTQLTNNMSIIRFT